MNATMMGYTVNLAGLIITLVTNLRASLCRILNFRLIVVYRSILNVNDTIPWTGIQDSIKRRK